MKHIKCQKKHFKTFFYKPSSEGLNNTKLTTNFSGNFGEVGFLILITLKI